MFYKFFIFHVHNSYSEAVFGIEFDSQAPSNNSQTKCIKSLASKDEDVKHKTRVPSLKYMNKMLDIERFIVYVVKYTYCFYIMSR